MEQLGYKTLTSENWLKADQISGSLIHMSLDEYIETILKPKLDERVPLELRAMFEAAKGALAYGYLFYPLYALAEDQLFRVAEAAVKIRCDQMRAPSLRDFKARLRWLTDEGALTELERGTWDAIRKLRNIVSHPTHQRLGPPGPAVGILERMAERINSLFAATKPG